MYNVKNSERKEKKNIDLSRILWERTHRYNKNVNFTTVVTKYFIKRYF